MDRRLLFFVEDSLSKKYPESEIKKVLIEHGVSEADAEELLKAAKYSLATKKQEVAEVPEIEEKAPVATKEETTAHPVAEQAKEAEKAKKRVEKELKKEKAIEAKAIKETEKERGVKKAMAKKQYIELKKAAKKAKGKKKKEIEEKKKHLEKRLKHIAQIEKQRAHIAKKLEETTERIKQAPSGEYIKTGIKGLDEMIPQGIPKGSSVLVAGGPGTGKTILCLQIAYNAALRGKKCLYISFEESIEKLKTHMRDFNWDYSKCEAKGLLKLARIDTFDIARSVEALLSKAKGELLIDLQPVLIPVDLNFKPDIVFLDSLSAVAAAFTGRPETYRIYVEQLFRQFEKFELSFLITETEQLPTIYSKSGVEEFLADAVIVLYSLKHGLVKENAIEILKMRGVPHLRKVVAMQITSGVGIEVFPEQEIFGGAIT